MQNLKKTHWENIYLKKDLKDVSWYQEVPETSLQLIKESGIKPDAKIIDIGGGDSYLADHLLELGYTDITVLDISEASLQRAKQRLDKRADKVKWIAADAIEFISMEKYDLWHDRAAFHFLTSEPDITKYINNAAQSVASGGILILGTFSEAGPKKCSGLEIKQYSEVSMKETLKEYFEKIKCITIDHLTPSNAIQNFIFCSFRRI